MVLKRASQPTQKPAVSCAVSGVVRSGDPLDDATVMTVGRYKLDVARRRREVQPFGAGVELIGTAGRDDDESLHVHVDIAE